MPEFKYKAFISYSHVDEKWAKWVHRSLETYRVPKHIVREHELASNRLIPIFRDREELASSGDLSATIQQALANSENLSLSARPLPRSRIGSTRRSSGSNSTAKPTVFFVCSLVSPLRVFLAPHWSMSIETGSRRLKRRSRWRPTRGQDLTASTMPN